MRISGPTNPYHINVAYGLQGRDPIAPVRPAARVERAPSKAPTNTSRLVAGVVPGGVDFSGAAPVPTAHALPMYRHPADRNAAATAVALGKAVDLKG